MKPMNNEAFRAQAETMIGPVREINQVAADKTEKLVKLQVSALQSYAKLAISHWRAALAVKDLDSMKEFAGKHREYVEAVAEKAAKDVSAVMELGNDYVAEVQKVLKDNAEKAGVKKAA
jgi:phasin family protein